MQNKPLSYQRTLVLLKPDTVQRGLMGEIISRFEKKGLKIVAMKFLKATEEQAKAHYYWSDEEKLKSGTRTLESYKKRGIELNMDPIKIAEDVQRRLVRFMLAGPVLVMVIEGAHAIDHVRKLVGHGSPLDADVGTIRGDYTIDSYVLADEADRAARNLIHASSSVEEAERELAVWFKEDEIYDYRLAIEDILYSTEWEENR
ncbi:MAG: nucleoside-diphosphate kinase [Candidatus Dojkabacteria bacterium]|jgi:nucleoside-diphosphate kinase|nr:MAG: nucleoside-diphosphate kinase [Candidatus Dojkabacteria bacterium]